MAISKVVYKSTPNATPEVWMDATGATAAASEITSPKTAMLKDGVVTAGTLLNYIESAVNLYDPSKVLNAYFTTGNITASDNTRMVYIPCDPSTTYVVKKTAGTRFTVGYTTAAPAVGVAVNSINNTHYSASSITYTTGADAAYLVSWVYSANTDSGNISAADMLASVKITKADTVRFAVMDIVGDGTPNLTLNLDFNPQYIFVYAKNELGGESFPNDSGGIKLLCVWDRTISESAYYYAVSRAATTSGGNLSKGSAVSYSSGVLNNGGANSTSKFAASQTYRVVAIG